MSDSTVARWLSAPNGCPPPEAYAQACAGELESLVLERLEAHASVCPICEVENELARSFLRSGQEDAENADVAYVVSQLGERLPRAIPELAQPAKNVLAFRAERKTSPSQKTIVGGWNWRRLAAAAALAMGLGLSYRAWRPVELPDPSSGGAIRGGQLETHAPVGELTSLPARWSWTTVDGAATYRVRLLAVDDAELWQGETQKSEIVPGDELAQLVRVAVRYRWSVTALDASGRVLAESPEAWFRLRPGAR